MKVEVRLELELNRGGYTTISPCLECDEYICSVLAGVGAELVCVVS